MVRTVGDLIEKLKAFKPEMPVCIRQSEGDGYTSDWKLHDPGEFFPGGMVCLSAFERMEDGQAASSS